MSYKRTLSKREFQAIGIMAVGLLLILGAIFYYPYSAFDASRLAGGDRFAWLVYIAGFFIASVGAYVGALRSHRKADREVDVLAFIKNATALIAGASASALVVALVLVTYRKIGLLDEPLVGSFAFFGTLLLIHYVGFQIALQKKYVWFGFIFAFTYLLWLGHWFTQVLLSS